MVVSPPRRDNEPDMKIFLAIDSGGSKCEALCVSEEGNLLGHSLRDFRSLSGSRFIGGLGRSESLVAETIRAVLPEDLTGVEIHACGPIPDLLQDVLRPARSIEHHIVVEKDGPLARADVRSGIVVLAGTGAFVYGRRGDGAEVLYDGIGPLFGDYGSGFQIGLAGIRAAGRAHWNSRYQTTLATLIPEACRNLSGAGEEFDMMTYMADIRDRSEIASLAVVVDRAAEADDAIARQILRTAAGQIADTVQCVVAHLGIEGEDLPLIGTGSVTANSRIYWMELTNAVKVFAPNLLPILPTARPVFGLCLALADRAGACHSEFRTNLLSNA